MKKAKSGKKSEGYATDLTDDQWATLAPLLARDNMEAGGRPLKVDMRRVVNAILYLLRTGCQWRNLPKDFPYWEQVYYHYRALRLRGTWLKVHDALRQEVRKEAGKEATPSVAIIDSQSVKTAQKGGPRATTPARK